MIVYRIFRVDSRGNKDLIGVLPEKRKEGGSTLSVRRYAETIFGGVIGKMEVETQIFDGLQSDCNRKEA